MPATPKAELLAGGALSPIASIPESQPSTLPLAYLTFLNSSTIGSPLRLSRRLLESKSGRPLG